MRAGRVVAELAGDGMTEAAVLAAAFGIGGGGGMTEREHVARRSHADRRIWPMRWAVGKAGILIPFIVAVRHPVIISGPFLRFQNLPTSSTSSRR